MAAYTTELSQPGIYVYIFRLWILSLTLTTMVFRLWIMFGCNTDADLVIFR